MRAAMLASNEELVILQDEVTNLSRRFQDMELKLADRMDDLEQYLRRNNIRIFGINETEGKDTDQLIVRLCQDKLSVEVLEATVFRLYQVGKKTKPTADGKKKPRSIILCFLSYRCRQRVFEANKKLKCSRITIKEDLTTRLLRCYKGYQRSTAIKTHGHLIAGCYGWTKLKIKMLQPNWRS